MGQCCLKGSAEFGNPKKNTFKTDGEYKKLQRKQGTMGGGFTRTSLANVCKIRRQNSRK